MSHKLDWSQKYCVEKFLPLMTKWHLQENVPCRTLRPVEIRKKRNPTDVPSYVVLWGDIDRQYENLISDGQFEQVHFNEDVLGPWITTERQDLMSKYYADIVDRYTESIKKSLKEKKTRRGIKKEDDVNGLQEKAKRKYNRKPKQITDYMSDLNKSMQNLSLTKKDVDLNSSKISVSVNKLKRKIKSNAKENQKNTIESYMKPSKKRKSSMLIRSLCKSRNMSIDFKIDNFDNDKENVHTDKHFFSMFDTSDADEANLSDIVEKIVSRSAPVTTAKVDSNYVKLIFENKLNRKSVLIQRFDQKNCSTPNSSPIRKSRPGSKYSRRPSVSKVNTSYFFDKLSEERDAFEMSMDLDINEDYNLPNFEF